MFPADDFMERLNERINTIPSSWLDFDELPSYTEVMSTLGQIEGRNNPFGNLFFSWCTQHGVYEMFTKEYVFSMAEYLTGRCVHLDHPLILEVGAGNGRLTHHLRKHLDVEMIATDSFDDFWPIDRSEEHVENLDHKQAMEKYAVDGRDVIIVVSWMPYQDDWTPDFRENPNVVEYVFIGEGWGGCCGDESVFEEAVLEKDGFYYEDVDLHRQICRTDWGFGEWGCHYHSSTFSFRRY